MAHFAQLFAKSLNFSDNRKSPLQITPERAKKLFSKKFKNETRHIYLPNPDKLHTMKDLTYRGSQAASYAAEFKAMAETMEAYQSLIYDRVRALTQAQYHMEIHLIRERRYYRDNKVFYYLEERKVYDTPGIEPEAVSRTEYPGTERRKAIADFEAYQKSHPGIIAVKDIEKGQWER